MFSSGIICFPLPVVNTITLVWHQAAATTTSSATSIASFNSTGANLIVVVIATENTTVSLTDSKSNTWTLIRTDSTTGDYLKTYYCYNPTVGASHTFSVTSTSGYPAIAIAGFNNVASSPLDQQNGFGNTGVKFIQPGSITPSTNNCLIITGVNEDYGSTFPSALIDSGFTITDYIPLSPSSLGVGLAYLVQTTAATVNPTWTGFPPSHLVTSIVSFK